MTTPAQPEGFDAKEVERYADHKLATYAKLHDVIGSQIFSILERESRVLYYPLQDDDIWGFVEKTGAHLFVCINTSIDYDKQVFVAAHELYHVLKEDYAEELTLATDVEDTLQNTIEISVKELSANRFAAAFLVNEALLKREMQSLQIDKSNLNTHRILKLSNLFTVPYKTMVRRLFELEMIDRKFFEKQLNVENSDIRIMKNRLGLMTPTQEKSISLNCLNETAMSLYEQKRITVEKLEQVLRYSELSLVDMGIASPDETTPLTDAEIDALMGE